MQRLRLRGFGGYAIGPRGEDGEKPTNQVELALEPGTLYLVTGPNGAGKSTLVEAVAYALWGKSLRGEPMLHPESGDPRPYVTVVADGLAVCRNRRYGQTRLWFGTPDDCDAPEGIAAELDTARRLGAPPHHGTAKEAQLELESYVGTFERWRRTHVFSSADAAHFSLATDGERKRLIEGFLGLERFDAALEECRADIKSAERRLDAAQDLEHELGRDVDRVAERLAEQAGEDPEPDSLPEPAEPANSPASLEAQLGGCRRAQREAARRGATERAAALAAEQALGRLAEGEPCPACGREVPAEVLGAVQEDAEVAAHAARLADAAGREEVRALEQRERALNHELEAARAAEQARALWAERERQRAAWKERRDRADELEADLRRRLSELGHQREQASLDRQAALQERNELRACEQVLGLKGVRAGVLARALQGAEALANAWLGRLGKADMRLSLKPYTEKAGGGAVDSIGVLLSTGGDYRPYRSASGGERRRCDVALLLALGELAAASSGRERGTLFMDECFDCLDQEGQEAVLGALLDLAKKGPGVVVVTHAGLGDLLRGKPGVVRLHVEAGKLNRLE